MPPVFKQDLIPLRLCFPPVQHENPAIHFNPDPEILTNPSSYSLVPHVLAEKVLIFHICIHFYFSELSLRPPLTLPVFPHWIELV